MATDVLLPMAAMMAKNWWLLLLRGIISIVFGVFALQRPGMTLAALVLLFGFYAIFDGLFALLSAIAGWRHQENRWLLVLEGIIGLLAGFVTLQAPGVTAVALMFFIAAWALATGILKIVAAIRLRREITGEFWMILSGIAAVVFAFLAMDRPAAGALALVWMIGWFAILTGAMLVMLSFKVRGLRSLGDDHRIASPPTQRAA